MLVMLSQSPVLPAWAGQSWSVQQAPVAMHFDPHFFIEPQEKSHFAPSHVAVPPAGDMQASHDDPQCATELLSTQEDLQICWVAEHVG